MLLQWPSPCYQLFSMHRSGALWQVHKKTLIQDHVPYGVRLKVKHETNINKAIKEPLSPKLDDSGRWEGRGLKQSEKEENEPNLMVPQLKFINDN